MFINKRVIDLKFKNQESQKREKEGKTFGFADALHCFSEVNWHKGQIDECQLTDSLMSIILSESESEYFINPQGGNSFCSNAPSKVEIEIQHE